MAILIPIVIGLCAGMFGGLFGVGGGIIIVPSCIYFLQMTQKEAQGTSLLILLLPIGLLAVWSYWRAGQIHVVTGLWVALGFFFGALGGSQLALHLSEATMRRIFAVFIFFVAIQLFFKKSSPKSNPAKPSPNIEQPTP